MLGTSIYVHFYRSQDKSMLESAGMAQICQVPGKGAVEWVKISSLKISFSLAMWDPSHPGLESQISQC